MEYVLLTGFVAMAAIAGLEVLGQNTANLYKDLARTIDDVVAAVAKNWWCHVLPPRAGA